MGKKVTRIQHCKDTHLFTLQREKEEHELKAKAAAKRAAKGLVASGASGAGVVKRKGPGKIHGKAQAKVRLLALEARARRKNISMKPGPTPKKAFTGKSSKAAGKKDKNASKTAQMTM